MAAEHYQLLLNALKTTQELRASVANVFDGLSSGVKKSEDSSEADKNFLVGLQNSLTAVNNDFRWAVRRSIHCILLVLVLLVLVLVLLY